MNLRREEGKKSPSPQAPHFRNVEKESRDAGADTGPAARPPARVAWPPGSALVLGSLHSCIPWEMPPPHSAAIFLLLSGLTSHNQSRMSKTL